MRLLRLKLPVLVCTVLALTVSQAAADVIVTASEKEGQKLVRVNLTTNVVTTLEVTAAQPDSLAVDLLGRVIYDETDVNQLRIFDPAGPTDTLLASAVNGINSPQDIVLEPPTSPGCPAGHECVLVSNFLGSSITRTDITTMTTTPLITGLTFPEGLAFDNAGHLFVNAGWGPDGTTSKVYQINPLTGVILNTSIAFDPTNTLDGLTFEPSTARLYATSENGNAIYSVDPATLIGTNVGTIPTPDGLTNNGAGLLYVASRGTSPIGNVFSFNVLTFVATQLTPVPGIDDLAQLVQNPPSIMKTFGTTAIVPGGTTTMTIVITGPVANASTGVGFVDSLPTGLVVSATPNLVNGCGGTLAGATAGSTALILSGVSLAAGGTCTITISITDNATSGTQNNCVTVTSGGGTGNQSCAMLIPNTPVLLNTGKAFGDATILLNGTTSMTITIMNPNTFMLTGINFMDMLPAGLAVAANPALVNTCGGIALAPEIFVGSGLRYVSLTGGSLASGGTCTITLNVTGVLAGLQTNTVTVNGSGPQSVPATPSMATAQLTVIVPPAIAKSFAAATVPIGGTTTLSFNITNPNTSTALTGIAFTDVLPSGLVIAVPNGLTGACNGTVPVITPPSTISLTGATLPASGTCSFSVNVTGMIGGLFTNTTSTVTSTNGGAGPPATAILSVMNPTDFFQIRYASNLNIGDSFVNITNTGASITGTSPGNLCVNVYTFDQSEELLSCCSCFVTPNALASISVKGSLISNNLTPEIPNSVVIKLLATTAGTSLASCNAAVAPPTSFAGGLRAWGTTLHAKPTTPTTYGITETPFLVSDLSTAELNHLTTFCAFIQSNASGFGICKGCSTLSLGATTAH